jgi:hypothetical protein
MHLYWENNPYGLSEDIFDRIATSFAVGFIANLKHNWAEYLKRLEDFKDQGNDWEEVTELLGFQPDYLFREFLEDIKARYPGKLDDYIGFEGAEPRGGWGGRSEGNRDGDERRSREFQAQFKG